MGIVIIVTMVIPNRDDVVITIFGDGAEAE